MSKRVLIAILLIYVVWCGLDFVMHTVILGRAYEATAWLWRPMPEMKMGLMQVVSLVMATAFVLIYALWFKEHGVKQGLKYGLVYGLGSGVSMGYGTYSVMPIPYYMALTWFLGIMIEMSVAGVIAGLIVKRSQKA